VLPGDQNSGQKEQNGPTKKSSQEEFPVEFFQK
jgi:hypothetical protein